MLQKTFWLATLERALKTFAQTALAFFVGDQVGITDLDWPTVLSVAGLAALSSVLTSIIGSGGSGPSLGNFENLSKGKKNRH